jgi:hypothetical protein
MKTIITILTIIAFFAFESCRKDCPCDDPYNPVCPNYDSCLTKKPVTADFWFGIVFREDFKHLVNGQEYRTDDSIFNCGGKDSMGYTYGVRLTFIPTEKNAKYTWKLGSEIITDRVFSRSFEDAIGPQRIPVTLIIEKEPNRICFPNDDGKDTVTKYVELREQWDFPIMGKFKVLFDGAKDSSFIEVRPWEAYNNCSNCRVIFTNLKHPYNMTLINFKNNQDTLRSPYSTWYSTGNRLIFEDNLKTPGGGGVGEINNHEMKLNADGTVEAKYTKYVPNPNPNPYKYYHQTVSFKGRKIQ